MPREDDVRRIVSNGRARGLTDDQIRSLVKRYDARGATPAPDAPPATPPKSRLQQRKDAAADRRVMDRYGQSLTIPQSTVEGDPNLTDVTDSDPGLFAARMIGNIPSSAANLAMGLGRFVGAAVDPNPLAKMDLVSGMIEAAPERYGHPIRTLGDDPVGVAAELFGLKGIGAGAMGGARAAGRAAKGSIAGVPAGGVAARAADTFGSAITGNLPGIIQGLRGKGLTSTVRDLLTNDPALVQARGHSAPRASLPAPRVAGGVAPGLSTSEAATAPIQRMPGPAAPMPDLAIMHEPGLTTSQLATPPVAPMRVPLPAPTPRTVEPRMQVPLPMPTRAIQPQAPDVPLPAPNLAISHEPGMTASQLATPELIEQVARRMRAPLPRPRVAAAPGQRTSEAFGLVDDAAEAPPPTTLRDELRGRMEFRPGEQDATSITAGQMKNARRTPEGTLESLPEIRNRIAALVTKLRKAKPADTAAIQAEINDLSQTESQLRNVYERQGYK